MTVDIWDFIVFCVGLLVTGIGALIGSMRWFANVIESRQMTSMRRLHERIDHMEDARQKDATSWRAVERELLELKADLPQSYVRLEDYIRGQSLLEAKMDALAVRIENLLLKGAKNG